MKLEKHRLIWKGNVKPSEIQMCTSSSPLLRTSVTSQTRDLEMKELGSLDLGKVWTAMIRQLSRLGLLVVKPLLHVFVLAPGFEAVDCIPWTRKHDDQGLALAAWTPLSRLLLCHSFLSPVALDIHQGRLVAITHTIDHRGRCSTSKVVPSIDEDAGSFKVFSTVPGTATASRSIRKYGPKLGSIKLTNPRSLFWSTVNQPMRQTSCINTRNALDPADRIGFLRSSVKAKFHMASTRPMSSGGTFWTTERWVC